MATLQIDVVESPRGIVVRLVGQADFLSTDSLQIPLRRLLAQHPARVVFDLAGLWLISSLALGVLVSFRRALARENGNVWLAALTPEVRAVLQMSGALELFGVADTVDQAFGPPEEAPALPAVVN
jgi:anti-sigma B factor antagonist